MSTLERIADDITRQERAGQLPSAIYLTEKEFAELAEDFYQSELERQRQSIGTQAFLDEISTRYPRVKRERISKPHEPRRLTWDCTLFGLPLRRAQEREVFGKERTDGR